jgi:hypothetical protein
MEALLRHHSLPPAVPDNVGIVLIPMLSFLALQRNREIL